MEETLLPVGTSYTEVYSSFCWQLLAHALIKLGITRGDRVGIILSQRPETAVAHLAAYKLGAIALPLSTLFGPEALDYRLVMPKPKSS